MADPTVEVGKQRKQETNSEQLGPAGSMSRDFHPDIGIDPVGHFGLSNRQSRGAIIGNGFVGASSVVFCFWSVSHVFGVRVGRQGRWILGSGRAIIGFFLAVALCVLNGVIVVHRGFDQ